MTIRNLTDLYRPRHFEDVVGQDEAVRYLSGLVTDGKRRQNVLLYGDVGSGKTTLALILARAFNCVAPVAGSPCGTCNHCLQPRTAISNLLEHDTPRRPGVEHVDRLVKDLVGTHLFPQVVLFDEAHALASDASDSLLKTLEDSEINDLPVAFVFATTDPEKLRPALRSRLKRLHVTALDYAASLTLLRRVADLEGITVESGSLEMIARYAGGQPRDLLQLLDTASDRRSGRLRAVQVKAFLGYDQVDTLEEYFMALADGDLATQTRLFGDWRQPIAVKIEWVQAYLNSFYMRTVRGEVFNTDPVVDGLIAMRSQILQRFLDRGGFTDKAELAPTLRGLMRLLLDTASGTSDASLAAHMVLFHEHCSASPWIRLGTSGGVLKVPSEPERSVTHSAPQSDGFVSLHEIGVIYDAASALTQLEGTYYSLLLEVRPSEAGVLGDVDAVEFIDECVGEIIRVVDEVPETHRQTNFAAIRVAENSPTGPIGYVALHIPDAPHADDERLAPLPRLAAWIEATPGLSVLVESPKPSARQHWRIVRKLSGGFQTADPELEAHVRSRLQLGSPRFATKLPAEPVRIWGSSRTPEETYGPHAPFHSGWLIPVSTSIPIGSCRCITCSRPAAEEGLAPKVMGDDPRP